MKFNAWQSIESFHSVLKDRYLNHLRVTNPIVQYRAKVKLHGTNAAIRIFNGEVKAQKRSDFCSVENDNYEFAKFVDQLHVSHIFPDQDITIFGEWFGPGVQSGVAASKVSQKIFAVFAMQIDDAWITCPYEINDLLYGTAYGEPGLLDYNERVKILPWQGPPYTINLNDQTTIADFVEVVNQMVLDVEKCDPFIKDTYDIEGMGEGLVFYPHVYDPALVFKAKGEKHRVNKTKSAAQVDPDVLRNQQEFAEMFATEQRFIQGVKEACEGQYDVKKTGNFLKWVMSDIAKESLAEVEASGYEWKRISGLCSNTARNWYMQKANSL